MVKEFKMYAADDPARIHQTPGFDRAEKAGERMIEFRLYNDDQDLDFIGQMTFGLYDSADILDPLDSGEADYGSTTLKVLNPDTKKWQVI